MSDDLGHLYRVYTTPQGPGHEAMPEQVGMHGLAESGPATEIPDDVTDRIRVERLISACPPVAAEGEEYPVRVASILRGTGSFDVSLESPGQLGPDWYMAVAVSLAADKDERTPGPHQ